MSTLLKKSIFSILSALILFFSFAPYFSVKAQSTTAGSWYNSSFTTWYGKVYDSSNPSEIFGERYTAAQVQWVIYSVLSFVLNQAVGVDNAPFTQCFISNFQDLSTCTVILQKLFSVNPVQSNLAKALPQKADKSLFSMVFATDRPLSGIGYLHDKITNFSIVPKVHAQAAGFGFDMLKPIQKMWSAVRDISFSLFVLAMVILAFMIMFRVKISPQVVISVQSAIPKVIIALILVTFSYAIAGFVIDLMYVVIGLFSVMAVPFLDGTQAPAVFNMMTLGQPLGGNVQMGFLFMGLVYVITFVVALVILLFLNIGIVGGVILISVGSALGGAILSLAPWIGIVILVIAAIVVIWLMVRIWWGLVKAFAMTILLVIAAPLQITAGIIIPNFGFGRWLKSLISNLSVFVVTGLMILLSNVFLMQAYNSIVAYFSNNLNLGLILGLIMGSGAASAVAPQLGSASWPPLLGGGNSYPGLGLLFLGISFVLFTMIPKATELIQAFITGKPFAYGTAVGEAFGAVAWGRDRVQRSPAYRAFSEGIGYGQAARGLEYLEGRPWGVNLLRSTSRFTGIDDVTAKDLAANLRAKSMQREKVTNK